MNILDVLKLLKFRVRLEGMLAENKYRADCGHTIAYTEENFSMLEDEINGLIKEIERKKK